MGPYGGCTSSYNSTTQSYGHCHDIMLCHSSFQICLWSCDFVVGACMCSCPQKFLLGLHRSQKEWISQSR